MLKKIIVGILLLWGVNALSQGHYTGNPKERAEFFDVVEAIYDMESGDASWYLNQLGIQENRRDYFKWKKAGSGSWKITRQWTVPGTATITYYFDKYYEDKDNDGYGNKENYIYLYRTYTSFGLINTRYETGIVSNDQFVNVSDVYGTIHEKKNYKRSYEYGGVKWVTNNFGFDCDDTDANTPSGTEIYYADWDGDGFGSTDYFRSQVHLTGCPPVYVSPHSAGVNVNNNEDCNDFHAEVTTSEVRWYRDLDGDDYGDPNDYIESCERQSGYVLNPNDCNDGNPMVNLIPITWYADQDNDGFGDPDTIIESCYEPTGYVTNCYFDDCPTEAGTRDNGCPVITYDFNNDNQNYSYQRIYQKPSKINHLTMSQPNDVIEQITYADGIGRTKQASIINASPNGKDIIRHFEYDGNGEKTKSYLPYTNVNTNGQFDSNSQANTLNYYNIPVYENTTNPYSEVITESSPLNRVLDRGSPGDIWKVNPETDTDHTVKSEYKFNHTGDYVRHFSATLNSEGQPKLLDKGLHAENTLYKTVIKNENWKPDQRYPKDNTTEEFKDHDGKLILQRKFYYGKWLDTYYVYNNIGNLIFVIPPKLNTYEPLGQQTWMNQNYYYENINSLFYGNYEGETEININTYVSNAPTLSVEIMAYLNQPVTIKAGLVTKLDFDPPLPDIDLGFIYHPDSGDVLAELYTDSNALYIEPLNDEPFEEIEAQLDFDLSDYLSSLSIISQESLDKLAYQYKYDYRNRLIEKKTPGKGWEYIVYDKLDRPVLTQDANQRSLNQWLFTKYDTFGRVSYTGIYNSLGTRKEKQNEVDSSSYLYERRTQSPQQIDLKSLYYSNRVFPIENLEVLTINYYEDYEVGNIISFNPANVSGTWEGMTASSQVNDLPTVSQVKVLNTNKWITNAIYYDDKGRPWETYSKNDYLGTEDWVLNKLDFTGKVLKSQSQHIKDGVTIITLDTFSYDDQGRLLTLKQKINNGSEEMIVNNRYNDLGQLIGKDVGNSATNPLQKIDYSFNVRGWLKGINNPNDIGNDLFTLGLNYENPQGPTSSTLYNTPLYNGNISHVYWKTNNESNVQREYTYRYDALNRLERAFYAENGSFNNKYYTYSKYDRNGNIEKLYRNGLNPTNTNYITSIDVLLYKYSGNQLQSVTDERSGTIGLENFVDGNKIGNDYSYDDNGNLTLDKNKGIVNITYNHLNLPMVIETEEGEIVYTYSAIGEKIRKEFTIHETDSPPYMDITTYTDYAGNYIYEKTGSSDQLKFLKHPEGYIEPTFLPNGDIRFDYIYQLKDHLGNLRISYSDKDRDGKIDLLRNNVDIDGDGDYANEILEENNYYPYGTKHKGYNNLITSTNPALNYRFNGTELNENLGLNLYEMDFRQYDPLIARWTGVDPVTHYTMSPYNAFDGNPIFYADPRGADSERCCGDYFNVPDDQVEDLGWLIINSKRNVQYGMASDYYGDLTTYKEDFDFYGDYDQVFSQYTQRWGNSYVPVALKNDLNTIDATGFNENFSGGWTTFDENGTANFWMNTTAYGVGGSLTMPFAAVAGPGAGTSVNLSKLGTSAYSIYKSILGANTTVQAANTVPSNNIAFGLGKNLFSFAESKGFLTYRDFSTGFQVDKISAALHNPANNIHFNLDGMSMLQFSKFKPGGPIGYRNITNWELHTVLNNSEILSRTTFYRFGEITGIPRPF
ncbi:DUF6443 domain-containing protein [Aquimarina sp. M1]